MKKDNFKWWGIILIAIIFVLGGLVVRAEDDERDEEDEEHQEDREDDEDDERSESSNNLSQATTTTSKSVETVVLKDSDGDGILDKDDEHPDIAEIYIVKDDNKNGIVDSFEK